MAFDMNVWTTEIRRGIVEMCVLSVLQEQEGYGYEILERLRNEAELELTESTIYPLLANDIANHDCNSRSSGLWLL